MNFLDAFDISTSSPSTPTPERQQEQSLNDEVTQVVGQLTRFWGGFRKQSQSAFEAARKDLGDVVSQAQKEISRLTNDAPSEDTAPVAPAETPSPAPVEEQESEEVEEKDIVESFHETEAEAETPVPTPTPTPSGSTTNVLGHARNASQNIFSRLQANIPPNIVTSVHNQLPESLKYAPGSIDFANIRNTLTNEFQRVQGITRAQAEEYVHRSEGLLKEAGEFLKDAVKVLPPQEGSSSGAVAPAGMLWDGTDFWMLPDVETTPTEKGKERASNSSRRPSTEGLRAVATRAESLLKQLRHDPEVIRVNPEADERAKALYDSWVRDELDSKEGGIGDEEWSVAIEKALADPVDGEALKATRDTLVPSAVTSDIFWTRYFFRVHQVEREEERRKALIQGTVDNDEDFSWEDDEDEVGSPTTAKASFPSLELAKSATQAAAPSSPTSSEDVDRLTELKSATSSPEVVSNAGESKTDETPKDLEDDADSDWE